MPTLIDELIVRLGFKNEMAAQTPGVKKNLDDIGKSAQGAESGVQGIGKASKDTAGELGALTGKLGAFLALIGGTAVLKAFVRDTLQANTQLYFLSRNLGLSSQSVSAWGMASEALGGSAKGLQGALAMLSQEQTKLRMGTSALLPYFAAMGVSMAGTSEDMFRNLNRWTQGKDRTFAHNILAQMGFHEGSINLLLMTTKAFDQLNAAMKKFGPTDAETAHAQQMTQQLTLMEMQFKKIGTDLLDMATPRLEGFINLLQRFGAWVQEHEDIAATFSGVALALSAIGAAAALLSGPIGLAAAGIIGVSGSIALLKDDYRAWSEGAPSMFDWEGFAKRISLAKDAFNFLGNEIEKATDKYAKWAAQHPNIDRILKAIGMGALATSPLGALSEVTGITLGAPEVTQKVAQAIEIQEGFHKQGSVAQRANNPGDIEYGPFAKAHGATGSITAEGGKEIAVFPDVGNGFSALIDLLQTKYAGMALGDVLAKYSGLKGADLSSYVSGVLGNSGLPSSTILPGVTGAGPAAAWRSTFDDIWSGFKNAATANTLGPLNSIPSGPRSPAQHQTVITNNFGDFSIQTQATDAKGIAKSLKREIGTDFLYTGAQANSASQ